MTDKDDPRIAAVKAATETYENARQAVEKVVLDALRAPGAKPTKIAAVSPWTAAHVRKLARDHGIKADPAYQKRTEAIRKRAAEAVADEPAVQPTRAREPMKFPARVFALIPARAKAVALLAYERADEEQQRVLVEIRKRVAEAEASASDRDRAVIEAAMKFDPPIVTEEDLLAR